MTSIKTGVTWRPERYVPLQVVTTIPARNGLVQVTIVTEYDTFSELWEALVEDGCVYGARLILDRDDGQDTRRVRIATPYILGRAAVASIAPPHFHLDEGEVAQALYDFDWGADGDEIEEAA
jgi:hypothetical protein